MKNLLLATLTTLALGTAASAGGITFSLPNLTFPSSDTVVVTKDCLTQTAPTGACIPQD